MTREQSQERVETYVGATNRPIKLYAKDEDGAEYDLSAYSTAHLSARQNGHDGDVVIDAAEMTIDTDDNFVTYTPSGAELAEENAGDLAAQVTLTDGSGNVDYLDPFILRISKPILGS